MRATTRRTDRRPTAGRGGARRAAVVAVAVAALALGLAACGTSLRDEGGKQASQQAGSGPRPIKLASVFCVCFIGPYVAMRQGFFEREGVPVKQYVATKGGADTFQALAGGDVDFAISGLDAIIRGQSKGLKVRSVAAVYPEFYALTVRKDLAGKIRSIDDLKGRKVAISKIGSASWAFLQFVTRGAGLKEGDVKMLQLGGIDTIVAGLKAGKVDAAVTWQPGTAQVQDTGIGSVLVDVLRPADHQRLLRSPSSLGMTLAVRDELIEKNPEVVQRAVRALNKANAWIRRHSAQEVADAIAPLAPGVDRRVLTDAVKASIPMLPRTAAIRESAFRSSAEVLKDAGVIEDIPPTDEAFSCQFATCVK
jgi:NitT/TauT family transport system substrate-binding protein